LQTSTWIPSRAAIGTFQALWSKTFWQMSLNIVHLTKNFTFNGQIMHFYDRDMSDKVKEVKHLMALSCSATVFPDGTNVCHLLGRTMPK
jgi:hypothetical protein